MCSCSGVNVVAAPAMWRASSNAPTLLKINPDTATPNIAPTIDSVKNRPMAVPVCLGDTCDVAPLMVAVVSAPLDSPKLTSPITNSTMDRSTRSVRNAAQLTSSSVMPVSTGSL